MPRLQQCRISALDRLSCVWICDPYSPIAMPKLEWDLKVFDPASSMTILGPAASILSVFSQYMWGIRRKPYNYLEEMRVGEEEQGRHESMGRREGRNIEN
jgi:hypothetical protein